LKSITATIVTLNEEKIIKDVIDSISYVCDEIIVVDSNSTDNTVKIAKSLGAKVYFQEWLGDGLQKDFGVQFAKNDWILSIDADERLSENAVRAINGIDLDKTEFDAFALKRKTFIGNRWIKIWYPDYTVRLYNKNTAGYLPMREHASVQAKNSKKLNCDILHYSYQNYSDMITRINRFSTTSAKMLYEKGKKASHFDPFFHALFAFIRKFVLKRGALHGLDGFTVSMITAVSTYMKYMKLIEIRENRYKNTE
jgi:glycosyltransferase involved in cell wall biosynthesis